MNKNIPLEQIQDPKVSETDIDAVIDTNKELFDQLNSIPEIKALEAISIDDEHFGGLLLHLQQLAMGM